MKKVMIAAAIVCAAAMSQAATANWTYESAVIYAGYGASEVGKTSTTKMTSGTAYLVYFGGGEATGITQSQLLTALRGDKTMADMGDYILTSASIGSDGKVAKTESFKVDTTKMSTSGEDSYLKAYTVVVSGDNVFLSAEQNALYDGNNQIGALKPGSATSMYLRDNDGTIAWDSTKAGWYSTAAVPEPTSGLLLLLGVAGLALRRRRA